MSLQIGGQQKMFEKCRMSTFFLYIKKDFFTSFPKNKNTFQFPWSAIIHEMKGDRV